MPTRSLKTKLLWPLVLVGLASSLLGGWMMHNSISNEIAEHLRQQEKNLITAISVATESTNSLQGLQRHVMALGAERYVNLILVASASEKRIVASTRRAWINMPISELPDRQARIELTSLLQGVTPQHPHEHTFPEQSHYAVPILIRNPKLAQAQLDRAAIYLDVDTSGNGRLLERELVFMIVWLTVLTLGISLLVWQLTRRLILRPANEIISTMERRTHGDTQAYANVDSGDELQTLAETLNGMLDVSEAAKQEIQRVSDALSDSEARYAGIVSNAMDAIVVINDRHQIVLFNEAAEKTFGYRAEEVLHRSLDLLLPERYRPDHPQMLKRYIDTESDGRRMGALGEVYGRRKDGSEFPFEGSISKSQVGERVFLTAILRDITQRKQTERALRQAHDELEERVERRTAQLSTTNQELQRNIEQKQATEEALRQSEQQLKTLNESLEERVEQRTADLLQAKEEAERASRAKSEFLSRMSHELRTPMNAILGFAQLLKQENPSATQHVFVDEISIAGSHLLQLINELLDLSRIEAGRMPMVISAVPLNDILGKAVKLIQPLMTAQDIRLSMEDPQPCDQIVLADATRLRQVLLNLLSNAAKYSHEHGQVTISCGKHSDGHVRISVRDQGPGIAADQLEKIFLPFERSVAESSHIDGAGIGLALCKQLTELMGGRIGVESALGKGSDFWIEVPLSEGSDENAEQPQTTPMVANQMSRILYVEDNPANLRFMQSVFDRMQEVQLISASCGEDGLTLASRHLPDMILLDINLPDIDGYEVLRRLRAGAETRDIPVIAVSADAMAHDIDRGHSAGFDDYLTKPVDLELLKTTIQKILQHR